MDEEDRKRLIEEIQKGWRPEAEALAIIIWEADTERAADILRAARHSDGDALNERDYDRLAEAATDLAQVCETILEDLIDDHANESSVARILDS